jgi:hypothetical protein
MFCVIDAGILEEILIPISPSIVKKALPMPHSLVGFGYQMNGAPSLP